MTQPVQVIHLNAGAIEMKHIVRPSEERCRVLKGVARIFQRGVTLCQSEGTYQIVMSTTTPCFTLTRHVSDVVIIIIISQYLYRNVQFSRASLNGVLFFMSQF